MEIQPFAFVAEGTDLSGNPHRYEDYVTFTRGSYEIDKNWLCNIIGHSQEYPAGAVYGLGKIRYYATI